MEDTFKVYITMNSGKLIDLRMTMQQYNDLTDAIENYYDVDANSTNPMIMVGYIVDFVDEEPVVRTMDINCHYIESIKIM